MRSQVLIWASACGVGVLLQQPQADACLGLSGIISGGGDGVLDFDKVNVTLEKEPYDLSLAPFLTVAECSGTLETPIAMRMLLGIDTAAMSVAMAFHPNPLALNIFGDRTTSDARRRCYPDENASDDEEQLFHLHLRVTTMYVIVYGGLKQMPFCYDTLDTNMDELELPISLLDSDADITTPWGLAKQYVDETMAYLDANDGWNYDGSMSRDYNKVPFSDYAYTDSDGNAWSPYEPVNSPWELKSKKRYQPLLEHDEFGYVSAQMHVTPHIGAVGRFLGFSNPEDEEEYATRTVADPQYKYEEAANRVLEESRLLANDTVKKALVSFFDNKLASLLPIKISYFLRDPVNNTPQDFYRVTIKVQLAIYNSIILAWKEKVRHDMPRPPTVIGDRLGDTIVEAYGGDDVGVVSMKASEWEAYIRTMPHSEFPSGSACVCQVFAEQMETYTGSDAIDPPLEYDLGDGLPTVTFSSWTEVSEMCGDSRLWGGLHFAEAVPAGVELCGGFLQATSIGDSVDRLIAGDESAAIFKTNPEELKVRST